MRNSRTLPPASTRSLFKHVTAFKRIRLILSAMVVLTALGITIFIVGAADQTWDGSPTGNATAWLTAANWVGDAAFPGSQSVTTNTDIATIPATGTNPAIGINMNFSGNTLYLGAINFTSTANRSIGDSSATAGTLQLNGATVNSVSNVIIRNSNSGTLTLQATQTGTMGVALGNATDNIINIDSTGGVTISSIISGSNKKLTLSGAGTGTLTLSGGNTYSGDTTISAGKLALSGAGSIANSPNITVAGGAAFDVSGLTTALTLGNSQTLKASGNGSTGTIGTASGKGLTLGATSGLQFTAYNGSTAPLTVTGAGSVTLASGNTVSVTVSGSALTAGDYKLIAIGSGNTTAVNGTAPSSVTVNPGGLAAGTTASLLISGGELYLHVVNASVGTMVVTLPGQTFTSGSGNSGTPTAQTAGTPFNITLTATLSDGVTIDTSYNGTKTISYSGPSGSPSYTTSVNFTNGQATGVATTLTVAETTTITATDGTLTGVASSSLLVNPGAINSYVVTASSPQTAGIAFNVTVTAKDANNNTVTTDSSTVVTMTSSTGNVQFDSNGDSTFGDNTKTLSSGTFTISAKDNLAETVTITATDGNGKTGTSGNVVVNTTPKYRSRQSGNWNDFNTWQIDNTGGGFVNATSGQTPTSADDTIEIQSGHTVTITATVTYDQVTVDSGGQVTVASGVAHTLNNGTSTDLTINGTWLNQGGTWTINSGATWAVSSSGTFIHNSSGGIATPLASATLDPASTFIYRGSSTLNVTPSVSGRTYGNLSFESTSGAYAPTSSTGAGTLTVGGSLSIGASGAGTVSYNTTGYTGAINVAGGVTIGTGSTLTLGASILTLGGNWSNSGTFTAGTSTVVFNGANNTQTISGSNTFNNLTINHTGTGSVTAAGSTLNVSALLRVQAGTFTSATAYNNVQIDSGATLTLSGPITVSGNWTNNGTFNNGGFTVTFNGTANQSISGTSSTAFAGLVISNTGSSGNNSVTLSQDISDTTLSITSGIFSQGTASSVGSGAVTVSSGATFRNLGTGDLTLSGNVSNSGTIDFNANGTPCGQADDIVITSNNTSQRTWSGSGTFSLIDVTVSYQAKGVTPVVLAVNSGTDAGNNTGWTFIDVCTSNTYTWIGGVSASWTEPTSWSPTRTAPSTADILIFDGDVTPAPTVSNVPTQTIAALRLQDLVAVTLTTSASNALTISGQTGSDLTVPTGSSLTLSGSSALRITLDNNSVGTVGGGMLFTGTSSTHQLTAKSGSTVTFSGNTAIFTTASDYNSSTNPFGTGADGNSSNSSIIFGTDSNYFHNNGASPFGPSNGGPVVVFQTGSTANWLSDNGFQANGRTYANLVIGDGTTARTLSDSGSGNFQFENLMVKSTATNNSSLTFTGSGSSVVNIRGDISSTGAGNGGTLSDVILAGGTSGGITIDKPNSTVNFTVTNNQRTITFDSNATVANGTTLALGRILIEGLNTSNNYVLTINGAFSGGSTNYVIGNLRKTPANGGTTVYEVGTSNGYSPVTISSVVTGGSGTFTARASQTFMPNVIDSTKVLQRYWTLANGGITSAILSFQYLDADVPGTANEARFKIFKDTNGAAPLVFPEGAFDNVNEGTNTATTVNPVTTFSNWSVGEPNAVTAVEMQTFNVSGFANGNLVAWRTGFEADNLGFNLYRMSGGKLVRVTPSPVAGSALQAGRTPFTAGLSYTWFDPKGLPDSQYYLEDIDLSGARTMHGPVAPVYMGNIASPVREQAMLLSQINQGQADAGKFTASYPAGLQAATVEKSVAKMGTAAGAEASVDQSVTAEEDASTKQHNLAAGQAVKISINKPGLYRVTQQELVAAGLSPSVDPSLLQLYADGVEQPIFVRGAGQKQFGTNASIEFYGTGMDTPTTDTRTYWLVAGSRPGKRNDEPVVWTNMMDEGGSGGSAPRTISSTGYAYTVERKDRAIYFTALLNGEADNFFGPVITKTAAKQDVTLSAIDTASSGPATLEVSIQGLTMQPHKVKVLLNGAEVGMLEFSNMEHPTRQFQVPRASLVEGNNSISLVSAGGDSDVNLADYVRLTYQRAYRTDADTLFLTTSNTTPTVVEGFTSKDVRVFDITRAGEVYQLPNAKVKQKDAGYAVTIPGGRGTERVLLAVADAQVQKPAGITANEPSTLASAENRADFIILTHRSLRDAVNVLADMRRSQGLETKVVDVEDVYDEFSYGAKSRAAIKEFLGVAKSTWALAPRYVLFVGDASYDPRNYQGFAGQDLVPTKLVDASTLETSSDDALADFDGDGIADMAVGRLPVQTLQQAQTVIAKIISYSPGRTTNSALLVSDRKEGYDFEAATGQVRGLLPADMEVTAVNRRDNSAAQVKSEIMGGINAGPLLVNYVGHGSPDVWTGASILSSSDIASLTNGTRLPLFVSMTCLNGRFQDSNRVSLAEALLKAENGGAVAVWASSGLTDPGSQSLVDQNLMRLLFQDGQSMTLGDAVRGAKAATPDMDVRRTWILFGDPTMRIR